MGVTPTPSNSQTRPTSATLPPPRHKRRHPVNNPEKQPRESIWSLVAGVRNWYFALFAILYPISSTFVILAVLKEKQGIIDIGAGIVLGLGPAAMASAATAFTATEIGRDGMVLAKSIEKWFNDRREKRLAEAHEAGLAAGLEEGQAKTQKLWTEWLARREAAEARGEPFTEPPPNTKP